LGYHFIITTIAPEDFAETLESGASRFIDGFLLIPFPHLDDHSELIRLTNGIPFVQIGAKSGAKRPSVTTDQAEGARLATQHLIDLGHREIAEISGPLANYDAQGRHESWQATLNANGIPPRTWVEGDFTIDGGYQAMNRLLDDGKQFTAVFVGNDSMAFGANTALRMRGFRVPDDISIVGFDDIPESAHFVPGLTTVQQNAELMGRLAVEYLVSLIEKPDTPVYQQVLIPKLIVRGTTAPISS
jgi:DNA-binding LacI/PurR family transcriptional regulator